MNEEVIAKNPKLRDVDLSALLKPAVAHSGECSHICNEKQEHGLETGLDRNMLKLIEPTLKDRLPVKFEAEIKNTHRATGTTIAHMVSAVCMQARVFLSLRVCVCVRAHVRSFCMQFIACECGYIACECVWVCGDPRAYVARDCVRVYVRARCSSPHMPTLHVIVWWGREGRKNYIRIPTPKAAEGSVSSWSSSA